MLVNITDKDFEAIRDLMYEKTGVFLKPTKRTLVMTRLRTKLEELKFDSFAKYVDLLKQKGSGELEYFINALTTNETYFFRHTKQFNYLHEKVLPEYIERNKATKKVTIWCGASSTGEEPYSLAILCREFFKKHNGWNFKIYASDINSEVIDEAREGIYSERSIKEVPDSLKEKYFSGPEIDNKRKWAMYHIKDTLKNDVEYLQHNLLSVFSKTNIDIIFLRNVMIYFDHDSKQKVASNLEHNLVDRGYLFISLSESLNDVQTRFKMIYSGVYQKL